MELVQYYVTFWRHGNVHVNLGHEKSQIVSVEFWTGVANPNWSLGRNLEILQKVLTFWAA
jgi:hypothetical protein